MTAHVVRMPGIASGRLTALSARIGANSALTVAALTVAALAGTALVPGACSRAEAASVEVRALHVAASQAGAPYRYGATGPYAFDCSGLTRYSYRRAGRLLPRTAEAQYRGTRHVPAARRRPGDLVFFHDGRYVYHVGIYAGHGRIWHAPRRGAVVRLERIWSRNVWYGRVR